MKHFLIPDIAWQLWYLDTFDRDAAAMLEASGSDLIQGLYELWMHTLDEGILDNSHASFSCFQLSIEGSHPTTIDIGVQPFHNTALQKLRQWTQSSSQNQHARNELVWKLAHAHFKLLQSSSRWTARSIDRSAEAKQLLASIDIMNHPDELHD